MCLISKLIGLECQCRNQTMTKNNDFCFFYQITILHLSFLTLFRTLFSSVFQLLP